MSAARPLGRLAASLRTFSTTPAAALRHRPAAFRVPAPAVAPAPSKASAPYTPAEIDELSAQFSPAQLDALLAGEAAIGADDFAARVERREGDPFALGYLDDLAHISPVLDLLPAGAPPAPTRVGKDGFIVPRQNLPPITDPAIKYTEEEAEETNKRLAEMTGMSLASINAIKTRIITTHSVTNQTRMGKIRKVYCMAIAGNGKGLLGVGEGKAVEALDAMQQAQYMAIRNMEPIPRYENRTIYGDVTSKMGAVEMKLMTRPPGKGP